jgi:hypothetical protein
LEGLKVIRIFSAAVIFVLLGAPADAPADTEQPAGDVEIRLEYPIVIRAARPQGRHGGDYLRNYLLYNPIEPRDGIHLESGAARAAGFGGLERYELSDAQIIFRGLSRGATLGLAAGAFGSSFGWWDDKDALLMMGAMSALGAFGAAAQADKPGVGIELRLSDDR